MSKKNSDYRAPELDGQEPDPASKRATAALSGEDLEDLNKQLDEDKEPVPMKYGLPLKRS